MASRIWKRIRGLVQNQVIISGSFQPNGTSAPTIVEGKGFTVSRTGVGLYTVTLADKYMALVSANCGLRTADNTAALIKGGDFSLANGTFDIRTYSNSGGAGGGDGAGYIPIYLNTLREMSANDYQNLAAHGGILASDSTPVIDITGTSGRARVTWAAGNTDTLAISVPVPPDLDASADVLVKLIGVMGGGTDTPAMTVAYDFFASSTSNGSVSSSAFSSAFSEATATIPSANVKASPASLGLFLTPGTHATDALNLYAAWIEYTKNAAASTSLALADLSTDADNVVNFELCLRNSSVN